MEIFDRLSGVLNQDELDDLRDFALLQHNKGRSRSAYFVHRALHYETGSDDDLLKAAIFARHARLYTEAERIFDHLTEVSRPGPGVLIESGLTFLETGQFDKAHRAFVAAYDMQPRADAALWVGVSLRRLGKFDEAIVVLDSVIDAQPMSFAANIEMAQSYEGLLRYREAARYYSTATRIAPKDGLEFSFDRMGISLSRCSDLTGLKALLQDERYTSAIRQDYSYRHAILWTIKTGLTFPICDLTRAAATLLQTPAAEDIQDVTTLAYTYSRERQLPLEWCIATLESTRYGQEALSIASEYTLDKVSRVTSEYQVLSASDAIGYVVENMTLRKPMSLIRLGDGEGNYLAVLEGRSNSFLRRLYGQILDIWFGTDRLDADSYLELTGELVDAMHHANIVGVPDLQRLNYELSNDPRGYWGVYFAALSVSGIETTVRRTTPTVHLQLFSDQRFLSALSGSSRLDTISCHEEFGRRLRESLGVGVGNDILVPGEMGMVVLPEASRNGQHFPDAFQKTLSGIQHIVPGSTVLVAAGLLGKIYCNRIKKQGGIAIDIGAVADHLMGFKTRQIFLEPGFVSQSPPLG